MADEKVNHKEIADKWQKRWEESKVFKTDDSKSNKYYVLEMFPYPSASGLHMGHALNYTIGDIFARFKRMQGFSVLYPMGFDSFGLPAENAAIKANIHPKIFTQDAITNYIKQFKALGLSHDWDRMVQTHKPDYYKWDQWIFLQMYKKGLVYKKTSSVNWCPKCNTVLANEQVQNGKCWRHEDTDVIVKQLPQWYLKITNYADELFEGIKKLDNWPELIKKLQTNWINKSYGTEIIFEINNEKWPVFTTRADTLMGVTFVVVAANHPKLDTLVTKEQKSIVEAFQNKLKSTKEEDLDKLEKEGVFTGSYAKHPLTKEKVPVYAGNFVLADYGSGMVMAVPAHDQRDFEFAKKYNISIKQVITNKENNASIEKQAYTNEGILVNSKEFDNLDSQIAKEIITKKLESLNKGKQTVNFRLRDWLISRQRYWGTPIPIYYDENNQPQPVPEELLPITLPEDVTFAEGKGNPLTTSKSHKIAIKGKEYQLENDTMDTFVNSSWYYLRYCDPNNTKAVFNSELADSWCPIDMYIGGKEHACMHLIYIRFYTKFLRDLGLLKFDEPAKQLFNQGMLQGPDGEKMSKSKGNVILPETVSEKFGLDAARFFLVSQASPDKDINWSDTGAEGSTRLINRIYTYVESVKISESSNKTKSKLNAAIRDVTNYIQNMKYNLATIKIRELIESLDENIAKEDLESVIKIISPFCPHTAEELWEKIGNKPFISLAKWPKYDESLIDEKLDYLEELQNNLRKDIASLLKLIKNDNPKEIKLIVSKTWKYEFNKLFKEAIENTRTPSDIIKKIMSTDLKKYGNEVTKLIPAFLKDESKLLKEQLTQDEELNNINKSALEKEFNCKITIENADTSKESKANSALPGKPSIIVY